MDINSITKLKMGILIQTDCYLLVVGVGYVFKERELQFISNEKGMAEWKLVERLGGSWVILS